VRDEIHRSFVAGEVASRAIIGPPIERAIGGLTGSAV